MPTKNILAINNTHFCPPPEKNEITFAGKDPLNLLISLFVACICGKCGSRQKRHKITPVHAY